MRITGACLRSVLFSAVTVAAVALPMSASGATPTAKPAKACTLLTKQAVAKAIGEAAKNVTNSTDECWYESKNTLKTVNLIRRTGDLAEWRAGYQNDFWTPNDYGDEGYTGTALDSIVWRDGATQYEVNVVYSTKGNPRAVVEQLAKKVNAKLDA